MDPLFPGVIQTVVVTVRPFKISSGGCCRFKPQKRPLPRFWKMDPSSPGVVQTVAVTVRQFEIRSGDVRQIQATQSAFAAILADGSVVAWGDADHGGDSRAIQHEIIFLLMATWYSKQPFFFTVVSIG